MAPLKNLEPLLRIRIITLNLFYLSFCVQTPTEDTELKTCHWTLFSVLVCFCRVKRCFKKSLWSDHTHSSSAFIRSRKDFFLHADTPSSPLSRYQFIGVSNLLEVYLLFPKTSPSHLHRPFLNQSSWLKHLPQRIHVKHKTLYRSNH